MTRSVRADTPPDDAPLGTDEQAASDADGSTRRPRRRWHTILGAIIMLVVIGGAASSPWWGPRALSQLAFFRVRRIEIDGARYATSAELLARLRVDTTWSVWTDLGVLAKRIERHPLVAEAHVERRLPATLHVIVVERTPVAMAPTRDGVTVLDADGRALPIDPSRVGGVDVPVIGARDTLLLRVLGQMRQRTPSLFARVSEARRASADEMRFSLSPDPSATGHTPLIVRAGLDVTPERFTDLVPVEGDLARRRVRAAEIDLRFRDQVIARLP